MWISFLLSLNPAIVILEVEDSTNCGKFWMCKPFSSPSSLAQSHIWNKIFYKQLWKLVEIIEGSWHGFLLLPPVPHLYHRWNLQSELLLCLGLCPPKQGGQNVSQAVADSAQRPNSIKGHQPTGLSISNSSLLQTHLYSSRWLFWL